ncbi:MAG: hypothetical protein QOE31_3253, partial [Solirubrobacteraceae bacterium]|nr:hypothetical protein [Solirubrobacteraceae bacterium]
MRLWGRPVAVAVRIRTTGVVVWRFELGATSLAASDEDGEGMVLEEAVDVDESCVAQPGELILDG